jgi:hypothetical protein
LLKLPIKSETFNAKLSDARTFAEAIHEEFLDKKGSMNQAMGYISLLFDEDKPSKVGHCCQQNQISSRRSHIKTIKFDENIRQGHVSMLI